MAHLWTSARWLGEALWAPFAWMGPLAGLLAVSVVCGVVLLLLFRVLTPQARLKRVKELMSSTIYEMRLFSNYPVHLIKAQGRALWLTARYLLLALPSFLVLIPVVGLLLLSMALVYEVQPLEVGHRARVSIGLDGAGASADSLTLEVVGDGIKVVPPVVLLDGEAHARVKALKAGRHTLKISLAGAVVEKEIAVATDGAVSPMRTRASDWTLLLGAEPPLPADSPVSAITVHHLEQSKAYLGLPWWLHFLIISMIVALALRKRLGVVF